MASSYYKVYTALFNTPMVSAIVDRVHEQCQNIDVEKIEWSFSLDDNGRMTANPIFRVKLDGASPSFRGPSNVSLYLDSFIPEPKYKEVINFYLDPDLCRNSGRKPMAKHNCKIDVMFSGKSVSGKRTESFQMWFFNHVYETLRRPLAEAGERFSKKISGILASPEFEATRDRALKDHAVQEILETMKKYGHLGQEVIKEGLDQYICHEILSC